MENELLELIANYRDIVAGLENKMRLGDVEGARPDLDKALLICEQIAQHDADAATHGFATVFYIRAQLFEAAALPNEAMDAYVNSIKHVTSATAMTGPHKEKFLEMLDELSTYYFLLAEREGKLEYAKDKLRREGLAPPDL